MEFEEKMREFSKRIKKFQKTISTEEATKTSLIIPFFSLLGYDVFNPMEFIPEYIADVGIKKGEKVDYAITIDGQPSILIEAKSVNENLQKHGSQLYRYFGTTAAKVGILTNGIIYKFYTDLKETNKMDLSPFLEIDLLNLKDSDVVELNKFCKENFDIDVIMNSASNLKYASSIEKILSDEFSNPSDDFVKLILSKGIYDGVRTQSVIDKYRAILKKSINHYINDIMNQKLQTVLNNSSSENNNETEEIIEDNAIITSDEEIECYHIVKAILSEIVNPGEIQYKDTINYFGILYENKVTKWICRVFIKENVKFLIIPDNDKKEIRYDIENISDIYKLKQQLIDRLKVFM